MTIIIIITTTIVLAALYLGRRARGLILAFRECNMWVHRRPHVLEHLCAVYFAV
jgi:hypothetical protein